MPQKVLMNSNKKTFVIDTNVFLTDAGALFAFDDNDVVIPMIVLEEIDRKKDRMDDVGSNARRLIRSLDELRKHGSLNDGVELLGGGMLRVCSADDFQGSLPDELNDEHPDNMIICIAVGLKADEGAGTVKIVTKDINMRIKCNVVGVECEDYLRYQLATDTDSVYTGFRRIKLPNSVKTALLEHRHVPRDTLPIFEELNPNEFIIDTEDDIAVRLDHYDDTVLWRVNGHERMMWNIKARNIEQRLALKLLADKRIKLVSLVGAAGTGKTLLAVATALELLFNSSEKAYKKLIITRPVQPVGKDLGYLPGTKEDKMDPWVQPIYDNIEQLLGSDERNKVMFRAWMDKGLIEVEAITYIRGRSLANAYIIIDEAQNLSVHELKTIVTRAGEGTKIVLTGDIEQVDNTRVDPLSNGLTYAVEKFKDQKIAGHVTLMKGERSELATLAARIL